MRVTKPQLRKMIREVLTESIINESWTPDKGGDLPPSFKEPSDLKITKIEDEINPEDPRARSVRITASKDGVSFESDFKFYQTATSGDKAARMAYEEAIASVREKLGEDK
jgi:hypothetical protein